MTSKSEAGSCDPAHIIQAIDDCYKMKEGSVAPPDIYLGAQIYRHSLPDGSWAWGMSSTKYICNAILTVESLLQEDGTTCVPHLIAKHKTCNSALGVFVLSTHKVVSATLVTLSGTTAGAMFDREGELM
jgi:hypothetical protein